MHVLSLLILTVASVILDISKALHDHRLFGNLLLLLCYESLLFQEFLAGRE